ncbi:disulfide bond formation protein B [Planctomycetes bacterium CA13]|uniref:Disulfide bond formation protein B n=1 Tax=Novipirellula herctigrandis TaxID=2527986 RepID=A0A5C5Z242_9BACT|nr:disulfide bond formation protein B [Planctomycetes bacterium CA13]
MNKQGLYVANTCCMLILVGVLLGAFYFQYGLGEDPCPLCLLQRMGMIGVALGLSLNTFFGFSKKHFAFVIFTAVVGCGFSTRQVLLHISPEPGAPLGYGTPFFGMHLYTWGVLIFVACILGSAIFLFLIEDEREAPPRAASWFEKISFYLMFFICTANLLSTFLMCGVGPCCENGPCP